MCSAQPPSSKITWTQHKSVWNSIQFRWISLNSVFCIDLCSVCTFLIKTTYATLPCYQLISWLVSGRKQTMSCDRERQLFARKWSLVLFDLKMKFSTFQFFFQIFWYWNFSKNAPECVRILEKKWKKNSEKFCSFLNEIFFCNFNDFFAFLKNFSKFLFNRKNNFSTLSYCKKFISIQKKSFCTFFIK